MGDVEKQNVQPKPYDNKKGLLLGLFLVVVFLALYCWYKWEPYPELSDIPEPLIENVDIEEFLTDGREIVGNNRVCIAVPDNFKVEGYDDCYYEDIGSSIGFSQIDYGDEFIPFSAAFHSFALIDVKDKYQNGGLIGCAIVYLGRYMNLPVWWDSVGPFAINFKETYLNLKAGLWGTVVLKCEVPYNFAMHSLLWWRGPDGRCYMLCGNSVPMGFVEDRFSDIVYYQKSSEDEHGDSVRRPYADDYFSLERICWDPNKNEVYFDLAVRENLDGASKKKIHGILDQTLAPFLRENAEIVNGFGGLNYISRIYDRSMNLITTYRYDFADDLPRSEDDYIPWAKRSY